MQSLHGLFEQPEGAIPQLPAAVGSLIKLPRGSPRREVVRVLRSDEALSNAVLAMAGSPYYSGQRPVADLPRLIDRVGLPGLRGLSLRVALDRAVFSPPDAVMERLAAHSTDTAYITLAIGQHAAVHSETAFACALLQHTGVAVPLGRMIEDIGGAPDEPAVWETLGCAHEAIAGLVAESWALPEAIQGVLVRHHRLTGRSGADRIIAALLIADLIASELDRGLDAEGHPPPTGPVIDDALELLDLSVSRLPRIQEVADEVLSRVAA